MMNRLSGLLLHKVDIAICVVGVVLVLYSG